MGDGACTCSCSAGGEEEGLDVDEEPGGGLYAVRAVVVVVVAAVKGGESAQAGLHVRCVEAGEEGCCVGGLGNGGWERGRCWGCAVLQAGVQDAGFCRVGEVHAGLEGVSGR